ncbi:hypothetical protein BH09SUM1_BH09SUM1_27870 [soil metagenome]
MKFLQCAGRAALIAAVLASAVSAMAADDHDHGHDHAATKPETDADHPEGAHPDSEEHHDEATLSAEAIQLYGITIEKAAKVNPGDTITVPARVALNGDVMAHIGSPVEGRIVELLVRVGDRAKKGDTLAIIDSHVLGEAQSDFLQKRSAINVAGITVEVSQKAFDRAKELQPGKGITLTEFQRREGELKLAEGALMATQAASLAAENRLHVLGVSQDEVDAMIKSGEISPRLELRAPLDGEVIEREVTMGEIVGPDRESLMVLADLSAPWILADVAENDIARVVNGDGARLTFSALPGLTFDGVVDHIAPVLDPRTRKGTIRIVIPKQSIPGVPNAGSAITPPYTEGQVADFKAKNDWCGEHDVPESACVKCNPSLAIVNESTSSPASLRAGMFGEAELTLAPKIGQASVSTVRVPMIAVQTVEGGPAVFVPVEGEPNTFAKRAIVIGPRVGKWLPVLSGLDEGESYVATGSFILKAELGKEGAAHEH